ncbi:hypothetical protein ACFYXS_19745 [Streptomyces sp. NPDC002574]|uniref:hypothetical protein n=1 Tax=Streptomyces sp. NPDC002574 TaxID=3364652 RepID=UPI0036C5B99D
MVALQIRDVPEYLRDRLAAIAEERGQSLQAYLLDLVRDEVRRRDNLAVLERFSRSTYGMRLSEGDVTDALRTARAERDAEFGVPGPGCDEGSSSMRPSSPSPSWTTARPVGVAGAPWRRTTAGSRRSTADGGVRSPGGHSTQPSASRRGASRRAFSAGFTGGSRSARCSLCSRAASTSLGAL